MADMTIEEAHEVLVATKLAQASVPPLDTETPEAYDLRMKTIALQIVVNYIKANP